MVVVVDFASALHHDTRAVRLAFVAVGAKEAAVGIIDGVAAVVGGVNVTVRHGLAVRGVCNRSA